MIGKLSVAAWKDPESRTRGLILTKGMISVLLIVTAGFLIVSFLQQQYIGRYALIVSIVWATSLILLKVLKEKNVRTVAVIYISFLLIMIFGFSWSGGGVKGHGMSLLPIIVVFSGLTVGRKQMWVFSIIAGVGGLLLTSAYYGNLLTVTEPLGRSHVVYWIFSLTGLFALTYLEFLSVGRLQRSLNDARHELVLRKESEANYRRILDSFQDVYYQTDMKGIITMITPSIKTRTGFDHKELIGTDVKNVYYDPDKRDQFLHTLATEKSVYNYDLDLVTKSGEVVNVIASSRIIYSESGKPVGIEGTLHDITDRKKAEIRLRKQNETLMEIAFLQSHIVRAPLTNIMGLVNLINTKDPKDPQNAEIIPQIETAALQLDAVVKQIVQKTNEIRNAVSDKETNKGLKK